MTDETPERIRVGFKSAVVIVAPFIWDRFNEQLKACLPVSLYLGLFQMFRSVFPFLNFRFELVMTWFPTRT